MLPSSHLKFFFYLSIIMFSTKVFANPQRMVNPPPECDISVYPTSLSAPGKTRLTVRVYNVTSVTIDRNIGSFEVIPDPETGRGFVNETRELAVTKTTTYTATTVGPGGAIFCYVTIPVIQSKTPQQWPLPYMKAAGVPEDVSNRYQQSLKEVLSNTRIASKQHDWNFLAYGIVSLMFNQDTEAVNNYMSTLYNLRENWKGNSLQSSLLVRFYGLFNDYSRQMPARLSLAAQKHLRREMFEFLSKPERVKTDFYKIAKNQDVWLMRNSENHDITERVAQFLFTQYLLKDSELKSLSYGGYVGDEITPPHASHSVQAHYMAWEKYFLRYLDERAKHGLFAETGSASYEDATMGAILNIADFAQNPVLRKKATMLLDLQVATMVEESLGHIRGGARSRIRPQDEKFWGRTDGSFVMLNLFFGAPANSPGRTIKPNVQFTTSAYRPATIIETLDKTTASERGRFEFIERRPSVLTSVWNLDFGKWVRFSTDEGIYRYGYATPGYIIGSYMPDPTIPQVCDHELGIEIPQSPCYGGGNVNNRWQGVILAGDPNSFVATRLTKYDGRSEVEDDSLGILVPGSSNSGFVSLQDKNILITQRWNNPKFDAEVFFNNTLDSVNDKDGWLFAREGNSFVAIKVVTGGYTWRSAERHLATDGNKRAITLNDGNSPIIMIVNEASDFPHGSDSFEEFRNGVIAQSDQMTYVNGVLQFAHLTFYGAQKLGDKYGVKVNPKPDLVYNSPFIRSEKGSGYVVIRVGNRSLVLDFREENNPQSAEYLGSAPSRAPAGVGTESSIVLPVKGN